LITVALKPPLVDQNFADLDAATTELSSIAIGIVLYFPFMRKLDDTKWNIEVSNGVFDEFIV
jgi:hypothetical protein